MNILLSLLAAFILSQSPEKPIKRNEQNSFFKFFIESPHQQKDSITKPITNCQLHQLENDCDK
ncbi:hypothetical protein [Mesonia sp.]|uniref:hypothetical protein n=1 Tax=Mesonia sp. TaxID=1960830 RepID=UPI0017554E37|nr:hypothetical protein [Mesonia sp.]HIB37209.1 hypothetical protein [Mesonia sp.]HIO26385.1 hypothetical protein [Flavobacteriaceae bacterium]